MLSLMNMKKRGKKLLSIFSFHILFVMAYDCWPSFKENVLDCNMQITCPLKIHATKKDIEKNPVVMNTSSRYLPLAIFHPRAWRV